MNRFIFCVQTKDKSIVFGAIKALDRAEARIELERIWRDRDIGWWKMDFFELAEKDFDYRHVGRIG